MVNRNIQAKILKMKRRGKHRQFTQATVNTGNGPNAERMQEYYQRLNSFAQEIPKTIGDFKSHAMKELKEKYDKMFQEIPKEQRLTFVHDVHGKLDLLSPDGNRCYFVEINFQKKFFRRSVEYSNKKFAVAMMTNCAITWVEQIPKRTCANHTQPHG